MSALNIGQSYRHILILESRDWWDSCSGIFDPKNDLVLTYDLALQREITSLGGQALYVDHLVDKDQMQACNHHTYQFFRDWHFDSSGEDIFQHRGIPFGFAFRIEIWNDLLSYVLARVNLEKLREINYEQILVGMEHGLISSVLREMNVPFSTIERTCLSNRAAYFFPIHRWMDEKVRGRKVKHRIMRLFIALQGILASKLDWIGDWGRTRKRVYFQVYHPTREIYKTLNRDKGLRISLGHFSPLQGKSKYLTERPIPIWGRLGKFSEQARRVLVSFKQKRVSKLIMPNGIDVSDEVYSVIEKRIESRITEYLRDLDCVINDIDRNPIQMEIMIANIGRLDTLVDCVCKKRGVPSYLIINGLMGPEYLDESKYATVINAYSNSIKENYFRGMNNVVCLGDPRMDDYPESAKRKAINREFPTVTIGASGFNIVDMNSYVAIEFEFMWDVLHALQAIKTQGNDLRIIIKVRPNGYRTQYEEFVKEFFPDLVDEIQDTASMRSVLVRTDLYISFYSQTLFEASCLGIPSIYYKKDNEIMDAPFDGESELVTIDNLPDLVQAIKDFRVCHARFDAFLQRSVMEKYVGPLDGRNVERNLIFIYRLLQRKVGAAE